MRTVLGDSWLRRTCAKREIDSFTVPSVPYNGCMLAALTVSNSWPNVATVAKIVDDRDASQENMRSSMDLEVAGLGGGGD